jgi:predicted ribosomally synthesized peptide with SipW-like signal peptide
MAILAGGMVLGLGTAATLASWTDTEWVFGGTANADGVIDPGVGTSTFQVQQNVTSPFTGAFTDNAERPGETLSFSLGALSLSPGEKTYAAVALKTTAESLSGILTLATAVDHASINAISTDTGSMLWNALNLRVIASTNLAVTCEESSFAALDSTSTLVTTGPLAAPTNTTNSDITISAEGAEPVLYCFEISLPEAQSITLPANAVVSDLQGRAVAPAWKFDAVSTITP